VKNGGDEKAFSSTFIECDAFMRRDFAICLVAQKVRQGKVLAVGNRQEGFESEPLADQLGTIRRMALDLSLSPGCYRCAATDTGKPSSMSVGSALQSRPFECPAGFSRSAARSCCKSGSSGL
ncbi:MAG: hypothetical protein ACRD1X_15115, partial [Vicinamibacteria bacterium]